MKGIRDIPLERIHNAKKAGSRIKLVAEAVFDGSEVQLSVSPEVLPMSHAFANLAGPQNAVQIEGDLVGTVTITGPGAGGDATASSVLGDLMILAKAQA
jgi:homoserine dehydrogenase